MVRSLISVRGHDRREAPRHAWECNFAQSVPISPSCMVMPASC